MLVAIQSHTLSGGPKFQIALQFALSLILSLFLLIFGALFGCKLEVTYPVRLQLTDINPLALFESPCLQRCSLLTGFDLPAHTPS